VHRVKATWWRPVPIKGRTPDVKSIFEACIAGLEGSSVPSYIQIVQEIPKTVSEKNLDRVLREKFYREAHNAYKFEDYI
jgi:acyl-coenzyme A synthetase/AMP-(fatty) acid ligase